ncbi:MAG: helix-turn-helix domain-containing protein [Bacillota bacterium]
MDLISGLQQMGLTEYEAKIYAALVKQPSITGYEASKLSGVPRAKVYETLESLVRKKAAYSLSVDGKQYYTPISHHSLIARFQDELLDLTTYLSVELDRLSKGRTEDPFSVVTGYDLVTETAERMCARSQRRLYISVFAEDLPHLAGEIAKAKSRGVKVFTLVYGEGKGIVEDAVEHYVSPLQYLQAAVYGRWMGLVADQDEGLMAQIAGPDDTYGLSSTLPGIIMPITLWIQHDIAAYVVAERLNLPPTVTDGLEDLWSLAPEEGPQAPEHGNKSLDDLFEVAKRKLEHNAGTLKDGIIEICFTDDGTTYHVAKGQHKVEIEQGAKEEADLRLALSKADFEGLMTGFLSPEAFMTRGRIEIDGDLGMVAYLNAMFR